MTRALLIVSRYALLNASIWFIYRNCRALLAAHTTRGRSSGMFHSNRNSTLRRPFAQIKSNSTAMVSLFAWPMANIGRLTLTSPWRLKRRQSRLKPRCMTRNTLPCGTRRWRRQLKCWTSWPRVCSWRCATIWAFVWGDIAIMPSRGCFRLAVTRQGSPFCRNWDSKFHINGTSVLVVDSNLPIPDTRRSLTASNATRKVTILNWVDWQSHWKIFLRSTRLWRARWRLTCQTRFSTSSIPFNVMASSPGFEWRVESWLPMRWDLAKLSRQLCSPITIAMIGLCWLCHRRQSNSTGWWSWPIGCPCWIARG